MPKEKNLKVSIKKFDAELAQHYLDTYNTNNYRKHNENTSDHYAKLMREDKWITSASPIAVSATGVLINGQHRLWAIIKSGVEVELIVIENALDESVYVVDTHKPRKMHDHCGCDAYLVTAVNVLLRAVGLHTDKMITNDVDFFKSHIEGQLGKFVKKMHNIYGTTSDPFTSWGVRGALIVAVLNGELTQKGALDLFEKLIQFRKTKVKGAKNIKRNFAASSTRAAIQSQLNPLMSTLVDYLDDDKLPVWSGVEDVWRVDDYSTSRDKAQRLMYAMGQAINRDTKDDTKFAKPMQVSVRQALGI